MNNHKNICSSTQNKNSSTMYIMNFSLFSESDVELFCAYKHFIENTIVQLGDDWRIQSGLLSQEIIATMQEEKQAKKKMNPDNNENDMELEFNIFNEFLLPFLKENIGKETALSQQVQSEIQEIYTEALNLHFQKKAEIIDSLTFKTLSLGFCITAVDQWQASFGTIKDQDVNRVDLLPLGVLRDCSIDMRKAKNEIFKCPQEKRQYILKSLDDQKKDSEFNENHIWEEANLYDFLQKNQVRSLIYSLRKMKLNMSNITTLCNFATNIKQTKINRKTVKILSIHNQFYRRAFIVWFIFNIKLFFTSNFQQYKNYFIKLTPKWHYSLQLPLKKFFLTIDREWNLLLKDYSVALHDDLQVLKKLIERVRKEYFGLWAGKRDEVLMRITKRE